VNRRMVLQMGVLVMAGTIESPAFAATERKSFFARHGLPLGFQLYTVHDDAMKNLDATLQRLAAIGYRQVELDGLYGRSATQMRASLDRARLCCVSMHVLGQPLIPGVASLSGDLGQVIANAKALDAKNVVMPLFLMPKDFSPPAGGDVIATIRAAGAALTLDDYKRMAEFMNDRAGLLAREGLRLGYHNHNFELAPMGGTTGLDTLLQNTDPSIVSFELDVGWAVAGGRDPIELLNAHAGRFTQMHVKDIKASTRTNYALMQDPTEVGSGSIAWKDILPVAYSAGTRNFFVEQEPPFELQPMISLEKSYEFLSKV